MFSLSELWSGGERQSRYQLLKPWWDVFMEHLLLLMLLVSVLSGTLLLWRDGLVCVPLVPTNHTRPRPSPAAGRRTHLDFQQYVYVNQVCFQQVLPWYSRFLPHLTLLYTLLLLASGCFWLHFPLTSARIEHFLSLLAKCCESPWTSRALSRTVRWGSETELLVRSKRSGVTWSRRSSGDSGMDNPLLTGSEESESHRQSATPDRSGTPLERGDREQARALFERVRRFRSHCESSDIIYKVYAAQMVLKVLAFAVMMALAVPVLDSLSFSHVCRPQTLLLTGYHAFTCSRSLAALLRRLMQAYVTLLLLFGLLAGSALLWIFHRSLKRYSFRRPLEHGLVADAPDLQNDMAFLLHMSEQYDPLLAQRLSVFLSPVSESRLLEESLQRRWGTQKLLSMVSTHNERSVLQLVALPRIPPAVFTLRHLQVLKLELISDARLTEQVVNMTALRELHLHHCSAEVESVALQHLQDHLESLHLTFTLPADIPAWVYSLRSLQELHLSGRLDGEGGAGRGWALGSLRQLRSLRVLVLRGELQRVPAGLGEVSASLLTLEIQNEDTPLLVLTGLRRVSGLAELRLRGCQLERLPSALLAMSRLLSLDLQHNRLRTLEEMLGLQNLHRLSCLRLAHNRVVALPASLGVLRSLELLDLSHNHLQTLPPALFGLRRLQRLLLARNLLEELPPEIGALRLLSELDLSGNKLEKLPAELFSGCLELRSLDVRNNCLAALCAEVGSLPLLSRLDLRGNALDELPSELACCGGLRGGGLLAEPWLIQTLPLPIRDRLMQTGPGHPPPLQSDSFPRFSSTQWCFHSATESQI